jgi:hypothetical protein
MVRYSETDKAWVSGVNPDETGMPTTNLVGDDKVCTCEVCFQAYIDGLGSNHDQVHGGV